MVSIFSHVMKRVRDTNSEPGSPVRRRTRKCTRNRPFHRLEKKLQ